MRHWAIKILGSVALLTALTLATPPGVTPAAARIKCGYHPNCNALRGEERRQCQADRAEAEADCQLHDTRPHGDARRTPGPGPKHQDCLDKAEALRGGHVDSATPDTSYDRDC